MQNRSSILSALLTHLYDYLNGEIYLPKDYLLQ